MNVSKEQVEEFLSIFNKICIDQRETDVPSALRDVSDSISDISVSIMYLADSIVEAVEKLKENN